MASSSASLHYIVAATPWCGSGLLCELLKGTGVAGRPTEDFRALRSTSLARQPRQYFTGVDGAFIDRLAPTDPGKAETPAEFAATLEQSFAASTTTNGVYGTTVMWSDFGQLAERLATIPRLRQASLPEAFETTFPNLHFVQIQRRDKVAQAVSLWIALQTHGWRDEADRTGPEPAAFFDFAAIDHLVQLATSHEESWSHWLARHDFPTFTLFYEDLANAPRTGVSAVIEWLDVPRASEAIIPSPTMRKQGDARAEEWAQRYRGERDAPSGLLRIRRWRR
jgi:LPS sulfotransferase NodH